MSNILNGITEAKRSPEPDYDDPSWDNMVSNVGQKAKEGPRKTVWVPDQYGKGGRYTTVPVNVPKKDEPTKESVGIPYPGTYEETNDMFKSSGQRRIGTLTTEDEQIDGMAQGEIREIIKNAIHIKNQLDKGVSLDGWMYSYVTTSNDHLNSVAEQINNPNIDEEKVRLDPKCWTGKHKEGTKMKGGVRVNNCVPNESAILKGLNQIDEGWKSALGSAALAGAMAMGSGHAQAADLSQFGTPYLQQVASGQHPRPMVNVDDAKAELQAREQGKQQTVAPAAAPETTSGFSIDYLKKASDPDRTGRYLISVEKAQEMLKQATTPKARPALNIAPGDYPAAK